MSQDIERMAREAGAECRYFGTLPDGTNTFLGADFKSDGLERFAALVRAQALEEAVKVCDGKERRKWEILTIGGPLEGFGPLDCARDIRALKG